MKIMHLKMSITITRRMHCNMFTSGFNTFLIGIQSLNLNFIYPTLCQLLEPLYCYPLSNDKKNNNKARSHVAPGRSIRFRIYFKPIYFSIYLQNIITTCKYTITPSGLFYGLCRAWGYRYELTASRHSALYQNQTELEVEGRREREHNVYMVDKDPFLYYSSAT